MSTLPLRKSHQEKPFAQINQRDYESLKSCSMLNFFYPFTKCESYADDVATYHGLLSARDLEREGYGDEPELRRKVTYVLTFARDNKALEPMRVTTREDLEAFNEKQLAEFVAKQGVQNKFDSYHAFRDSLVINLE
ncbi:hypothetical protein [Vibrio barjaei]|uniref:hypothetical protein n=1 Tax=Vibrio barjaei TaxID=1676683 RepID=UPI00228386CD|nr:hypothetical protein [Vibrio barjaei]MCY9872967.1 hypothetical protein [Vibrio barjaei]